MIVCIIYKYIKKKLGYRIELSSSTNNMKDLSFNFWL